MPVWWPVDEETKEIHRINTWHLFCRHEIFVKLCTFGRVRVCARGVLLRYVHVQTMVSTDVYPIGVVALCVGEYWSRLYAWIILSISMCK